jgi:hypothetical protein
MHAIPIVAGKEPTECDVAADERPEQSLFEFRAHSRGVNQGDLKALNPSSRVQLRHLDETTHLFFLGTLGGFAHVKRPTDVWVDKQSSKHVPQKGVKGLV